MPSCHQVDVDRFIGALPRYDAVFYKSLARNDHQWADGEGSHQSGVLIPRDSVDFFGISETPVENTAVDLRIHWFLHGETFTRQDVEHHAGRLTACLRYYCEGNRVERPESHLTCVYNPYFEHLNDGALLVIGRRPQPELVYDAVIIGPEREDLLTDLVRATGIPEAPSWGVVSLSEIEYGMTVDLTALIAESARLLYDQVGELPTTRETGDEVWRLVREHAPVLHGRITCSGLANSSSPFNTALNNAPGNLIRWMHERIEFSLLRHIERWHYPAQISSAIRTHHPAYPQDWTALTGAIGAALEPVISISKTITQSRRSRAGQSFENHVSRLLQHWNVPFERQAGATRLDFLLHGRRGDVPLSAKTSTRERWKQVPEDSYFITLDRQVGPDKLSSLVDRGIHLVVPEMDKTEIAHYAASDFVLRYRDLRQILA